jgi:hypothetical protein
MSQDQSFAETQVEPLSDDALEEAAGGVCSLSGCSGTTIVIKPDE